MIGTADCCGGGAAGDSATTLSALIEKAPDQPSVASVVDPQIAKICHRGRLGANVKLELGHKQDPQR